MYGFDNYVIVHQVDPKSGNYKKTLIFVGDAPGNILAELRKIELNKQYNKKSVSNFFGNSFVKHVLGGNDNDDLVATDGIVDNQLVFDKDFEDQIGDIEPITQTKKATTHDTTHKLQFVTGFNLYGIDKISEFKRKVFAATGVPVYRQHIWYYHKNRPKQCKYTFFVNDNAERLDANNIVKSLAGDSKDEILNGIPINTFYYKNHELLRVTDDDQFVIMQSLRATEFFMMDISDIVDCKILSQKADDVAQMDMIYYGFVMPYFPMITYQMFPEFVKNEDQLLSIYPDIAYQQNAITALLKAEDDIINVAYQDHKMTHLHSSIISTNINIVNYTNDKKLVYIRDLFDKIELDESLVYCKAHIIHEEKSVTLRKQYKNNTDLYYEIPQNSIAFKIFTNTEYNESLEIVLFGNGNYVVKTNWQEELQMTFEKITEKVTKYVNKFINDINVKYKTTKNSNLTIPLVTEDNVNFSDTSSVFHYTVSITDYKYGVFKKILDSFNACGLILQKDTLSNISNNYEFYFRKGMHKFSGIRLDRTMLVKNHYEHYTNAVVKQKWDTLFTRTRIFGVALTSSKLRLTINGISDDVEMKIFHMFLAAMFKIFEDSIASAPDKSTEFTNVKSKKMLKNLKIEDPALFNSKKIFREGIVYSRVCQKPYHPNIVSELDYEKMPEEKKKTVTKYWNFTKNTPAYYVCPDPKVPHVKFITNVHPKGYCLPCCKKMEMNERINIKKREIHDKCLRDHIYTGEKLKVTKTSDYIASYGKIIDVERMSRLPEKTLEPLFFDTYSRSGKVDTECSNKSGYFLIGVLQDTPQAENVGFLYCLLHALDRSIDDFLVECATHIRNSSSKMQVYANTLAITSGISSSDLADTVLNLNNVDYVSKIENANWNEFFMLLASQFLNVTTLFFEDESKEIINLNIPKKIKTVNEMFPEDSKYLIVIKFMKKFYPIYLFNMEMYKKTGVIEKKLFEIGDGVITIIKAVIVKNIEVYMESDRNIDLNSILKLKYKIHTMFINYSNYCYAVLISVDGHLVYIPVQNSYYKSDTTAKLQYTCYDGKYNGDAKTVLKVLAEVSKVHDVQQWIKHEKKIIAFMANNMIFYTRPIEQNHALKLREAPVQIILFDPFRINKMVENIKSGTAAIGEKPEIQEQLANDLFDAYSYKIVLLHFIDYFNRQRNKIIRLEIAKLVNNLNADTTFNAIKPITEKLSHPSDVAKLHNIFGKFTTLHHDKKRLMSDIEISHFEFDNVGLTSLQQKPIDEIRKTLENISKQFIVVGSRRLKTFPNTFGLCDKKIPYCQGSKVVLSKKKKNIILDLLANDITTDKATWMFNDVFVQKSVDFFKFISRENETIYVEIA